MRGTSILGAVFLCVSACTSGDGGAIVVRWRLVDAITGAPASGCEIDDPSAMTRVTVDQVRMKIIDVATDREVPCASCSPRCAPLEWTTCFEIPEGTYRFALEPLHCGEIVGHAPPPVVRAVRRGEITNLNAIGLTIPPRTTRTNSCPEPQSEICGPL